MHRLNFFRWMIPLFADDDVIHRSSAGTAEGASIEWNVGRESVAVGSSLMFIILDGREIAIVHNETSITIDIHQISIQVNTHTHSFQTYSDEYEIEQGSGYLVLLCLAVGFPF